MESAAAAQVAILNGVPFIAVRAVSDRAGAEALTEIGVNLETAATRAATTAVEIVRGLSGP